MGGPNARAGNPCVGAGECALERLVTEIAEGTARLLHVVVAHEQRVSDREGNQPQWEKAGRSVLLWNRGSSAGGLGLQARFTLVTSAWNGLIRMLLT